VFVWSLTDASSGLKWRSTSSTSWLTAPSARTLFGGAIRAENKGSANGPTISSTARSEFEATGTFRSYTPPHILRQPILAERENTVDGFVGDLIMKACSNLNEWMEISL